MAVALVVIINSWENGISCASCTVLGCSLHLILIWVQEYYQVVDSLAESALAVFPLSVWSRVCLEVIEVDAQLSCRKCHILSMISGVGYAL